MYFGSFRRYEDCLILSCLVWDIGIRYLGFYLMNKKEVIGLVAVLVLFLLSAYFSQQYSEVLRGVVYLRGAY